MRQDFRSIVENTHYYTIALTPLCDNKVSASTIIRKEFGIEVDDIPEICFGNDYFAFFEVVRVLYTCLFYYVQGEVDAVRRVCSRIHEQSASAMLEDTFSAELKYLK